MAQKIAVFVFALTAVVMTRASGDQSIQRFCDDLAAKIADHVTDTTSRDVLTLSDDRVCNGIYECADGVDESVDLCGEQFRSPIFASWSSVCTIYAGQTMSSITKNIAQ